MYLELLTTTPCDRDAADVMPESCVPIGMRNPCPSAAATEQVMSSIGIRREEARSCLNPTGVPLSCPRHLSMLLRRHHCRKLAFSDRHRICNLFPSPSPHCGGACRRAPFLNPSSCRFA